MGDFKLYERYGLAGVGLMIVSLMVLGSAGMALATKAFGYQVVPVIFWEVATYYFCMMFALVWLVAVITARKNDKLKLKNLEALKDSLMLYALAFVVLAFVFFPSLKWLLMLLIALILLVLRLIVKDKYTKLDLLIW